MKYSRITFFFVWCYNVSCIVLCESTFTEVHKEEDTWPKYPRKILSLLNSMSLKSSWRDYTSKQSIIVGNSIVPLSAVINEIYPGQDIFINYKTKKKQLSMLQIKSAKALYTALKCEFSSVIVNTLSYYINCYTICKNMNLKGCRTEIIKHLVRAKKYFNYMIYNLINFIKISLNLKLTDHSLFYTLHAMNLFLNYAKNYFPDLEVEGDMNFKTTSVDDFKTEEVIDSNTNNNLDSKTESYQNSKYENKKDAEPNSTATIKVKNYTYPKIKNDTEFDAENELDNTDTKNLRYTEDNLSSMREGQENDELGLDTLFKVESDGSFVSNTGLNVNTMSVANLEIENNKNNNYEEDLNSETDNKIVSDIDIKKVMARLCALANTFRCKHCLVTDYYYLTEKAKSEITQALENNTIKTLLDNKIINSLKEHRDIGLISVKDIEVDIPDYEVDMYDSKYLLLGEIFKSNEYSFIPNLIVRWNNSPDVWVRLKTVFEEVEKSTDIKIIFDYQILIFDIIKDLFYIKFIGTCVDNNTNNVKQIFEELEEFINKIIPKNYPSKYFSPIIELRNSLYNELYSSKEFIGISDHSQSLLSKSPIIKTWGESFGIENIVKKISMTKLIEHITKLEHFRRFIDNFELLAYEPNTLGSYSVLQSNIINIKKNSDNKICADLSKLRENLFLYHMLMSAFHKINEGTLDLNSLDDEEILPAKEAINKLMMYLYKTYEDHHEIMKIFMPLGARLKINNKSLDEISMIKQISLMNINIIEYFELNNCASPKYSIDMFHDRIENMKKTNLKTQLNTLNVSIFFNNLYWTNKNYIIKLLQDNTKYYNIDSKFNKVYSTVFNQFLPNVYFRGFNNYLISECSMWDGLSEQSKYVRTLISENMLDYRYLANYALYVMKLTFSKVFNFILRLLPFLDSKDTNYFLSAKSTIIQLKELPFPGSVKMYMHNVFDACLRIFENLIFNDQDKKRCQSIITNQLKSFDPFELETNKVTKNETIIDIATVNIVETKQENDNEKKNAQTIIESSSHHEYPVDIFNESIKSVYIFLRHFLKTVNNNNIIAGFPFSTCLV